MLLPLIGCCDASVLPSACFPHFPARVGTLKMLAHVVRNIFSACGPSTAIINYPATAVPCLRWRMLLPFSGCICLSFFLIALPTHLISRGRFDGTCRWMLDYLPCSSLFRCCALFDVRDSCVHRRWPRTIATNGVSSTRTTIECRDSGETRTSNRRLLSPCCHF